MFAPHAGDFGGADFGDNCGKFTGSELRDGFEVAAVFVAEREVVDQVFNGFELPGLQHRRAGRSNAFEICEGSIERESQL
jgi:hypothetical protein